jgi:hypothetical protein
MAHGTTKTLPREANPAWKVAAVSAALLAPCFWNSRIQAGDLGSHAYNAWLAQLIEQGKTENLAVASQHTNVLFDRMLGWLWNVLGANGAQQAAVAVAVLVFSWGAFAFVSAAAGRMAWDTLPWIAMLSYGWVFRMGFFNYYLSAGLTFVAAAVFWRGGRRRWIVAAVLAVAAVAHLVPVALAAGVAGYSLISRKTTAHPFLAPGVGCAVIVLGCKIGTWLFPTIGWRPSVLKLFGADQVWFFAVRYMGLMGLMLLIWLAQLFVAARREGGLELAKKVPFQVFCLLTLAIALMPGSVLLPGYAHYLTYMPERLSLLAGVGACAALAGRGVPRPLLAATGIAAIAFFVWSWRDERALDLFEDQVEVAAGKLVGLPRVVLGVNQAVTRGDPIGHSMDRACIGRCFSYANYEPSSGHFRVRLVGPSPQVAGFDDVAAIGKGQYRVKERDTPLWVIEACGASREALCSRELRAGDVVPMTFRLITGQ